MTPPELAPPVDGLAHHAMHTGMLQDFEKQASESDSAIEEDDFNRPYWPLDMGTGQLDGLEALAADRYENLGRSRQGSQGNPSMLDFRIPGPYTPAELALSAMQYLPYPLVVLNNQKTVVMANDAMCRLLGLEDHDSDTASKQETYAVDRLLNQTLPQMGIDMLQNGRPVWVTDTNFVFIVLTL